MKDERLTFYDWWMARQTMPEGVNVVQGPTGSCEALFDLVERCGRKVLKVVDAPNSHPNTLYDCWQRECALYSPGYSLPIPQWVFRRMVREIERADMVLCPSIFVRDTMVMNGVPLSKCFVSHFGVNTHVFKKRESLPDHPVFITVASLTVRNGLQYLLWPLRR